MSKTRTARTVCMATACIATTLISIGMILRARHAFPIQMTGSFATNSIASQTFPTKQTGDTLATKPVTRNTLGMMPHGDTLVRKLASTPPSKPAARNTFAAKAANDALATKFAISDAFVTELDGQLPAKSDSNAFVPKPTATNAFDAKPPSIALASDLETDDLFMIKLANDAFATKPATYNTLETMQLGDTLAPNPANADAFAAKPDRDTLSAKLAPTPASKPAARNTVATKAANLATKFAISNAFVTKPDGQLLAEPDRNAFATKPSGHTLATKNANAISRATVANKWQYWQYCLAPLHAEHKIYLSAPIPLNGFLNGADAAFDRVLKKAGLAHDEVQCPRAPNQPTLLFRQRYSISFNKEIGNTIINVNWDGLD